MQEKHDISVANADVVSNRDVEMEKINTSLNKENLVVFEVEADGHCLYRALADQINRSTDDSVHVFTQLQSHSQPQKNSIDMGELRSIAANEIQSHRESYAPFMGIFGDDAESNAEFDGYVLKVKSVQAAEWGGQVEIKALVCALHRDIWIYSSDLSNPIIKMNITEDSNGSSSSSSIPPLKVSYHRQYYALGEHYNSVIPI